MERKPRVAAKIVVTTDGPYLVTGGVPVSKQIIVSNTQGESLQWKEGEKYPEREQCALCRCGESKNKPFCSGRHKEVGFDGTETADRRAYMEQAEEIVGPTMVLTDAESLCAFARFCDPKGGVWNVTERAADAESRHIVEHEAGCCPGGRLVAWDKASKKALEPEFEKSIGLIEDPAEGVSGPIWVRGGIPVIAADGTEYEVRNRVALCRCGQSSNKPYCSGTHASMKFRDDR